VTVVALLVLLAAVALWTSVIAMGYCQATEIPETAIWKMLPFATVIGWPVNVPQSHWTGVPAESYTS
jgi:hypothetical protein